jgi:hypothetical protein
MSLIFPKKEILYAPMLGTLGGASARGFGRGGGGPAVGGILYETLGAHTFTVPDGVEYVHVVCIGGGGGGSLDHDGTGGAGGGLGWKNNIAVTSGQNISLSVGGGGDRESDTGGNASDTAFFGASGDISWFLNTGTVYGNGGSGGYYGGYSVLSQGGNYVGDGGGRGGGWNDSYASGGGGAGGYSGNGGQGSGSSGNNGVAGTGGAGGGGARIDNFSTGAGGGVGVYGEGSSGAGGQGGIPSTNVNVTTVANMCGKPGSGGTACELISLGGYSPRPRGGHYGGGGAAGFGSSGYKATRGGHGAVRIIWGEGRAFPSTNVDLASSIDGETIV